VHGGTCTDAINRYTCQCVAGYTGDKCERGRSDINIGIPHYNEYIYINYDIPAFILEACCSIYLVENKILIFLLHLHLLLTVLLIHVDSGIN